MVSTGELKTKISLDSAQFKKSMAGVNRQLKGLKQEQKAVTSSGNGFARGLKELNAKSDVLTRTLKVQKGQVSELKRKYDDAKNATGDNSKATQKANTAYQKARAEMNKTESQLKGVTSAIEKQVNPWKKLSREASEASSQLGKIGDKMSGIGENLTKGVTVPIVGFGTAATASAMQFGKAQSTIEAKLGVTSKRAKELSDLAEDLWKNAFGESVEESANAVALVNQNLQDLSDDELKEVTKQALTLRDTFEFDINESLRSAKALVTNFGIEGSEAFDYITRAAQEGGDYSQELLDTISEYSVQFNEAGFSVDGMFNVLIQGAKNGAFNLDKVGDAVKEFNVRAKDGSKTTAEGFEAIGLEADTMADKIAEGGDVGERAFMATIAALASMDDKVEQNQAGVDLFGTQWEDLKGSVITSLDPTKDMLGEVEGATDKAGKALQDNFGTKATKMWRNFQDDLEPAGETLLDIADDVLPKIAEGVGDLTESFAELSPEMKGNIVKLAGLAAVAGPSAIALGSVSKGVGGLVKGVGNVSGLLGKAGGEGLLGKVGLMGLKGGPVALAIAGVGALGLGIYSLTKDQKELQDVSLDAANSLIKQHESNGKLIDSLDKLRDKSLLTNDEFARYVDLQSELKKASDPGVIKAIKDEMAGLEEKSGFTNGELDTMVGLNNDITEALPGATKKITDQGNKIADTTGELEKYNAEISKMATLKIEEEFYKAIENQSILQKQKIDQQKIMNIFKIRERDIQELLNENSMEQLDTMGEQLETELETLNAQQSKHKAGTKQWQLLQDQIDPLEEQYQLVKDGGQGLKDQLLTTKQQITEQKKKIEQTDIDLSKLGQVYEKLQINYLKSAGITDVKARQAVKDGEILETIDKQIASLDEEKDKLNDLYPPNQRNTQEYKDAAGEIDNQIGKLNTAKGKINDLATDARNYTDELGRDVDKKANVDVDPSISWLNTKLGEGVNKKVSITESVERVLSYGPSMLGYGGGIPHNAKGVGNPKMPSFVTSLDGHNMKKFASGTSHHPEAVTLVGGEI